MPLSEENYFLSPSPSPSSENWKGKRAFIDCERQKEWDAGCGLMMKGEDSDDELFSPSLSELFAMTKNKVLSSRFSNNEFPIDGSRSTFHVRELQNNTGWNCFAAAAAAAHCEHLF
jgi:hypothetical protein